MGCLVLPCGTHALHGIVFHHCFARMEATAHDPLDLTPVFKMQKQIQGSVFVERCVAWSQQPNRDHCAGTPDTMGCCPILGPQLIAFDNLFHFQRKRRDLANLTMSTSIDVASTEGTRPVGDAHPPRGVSCASRTPAKRRDPPRGTPDDHRTACRLPRSCNDSDAAQSSVAHEVCTLAPRAWRM